VRYNLDDAPTVNGFSAGVSAYRNAANSTAFVARGLRDTFFVPGRVQIAGSAGVIYVTYGDELAENGAGNGEYLVIRDGCSCRFMEPQLASNHRGLVRTAEQTTSNAIFGPYDYVITRINATDGRVLIGKTTTPFYETWYTNPATGAQVNFQPAKEVLVCDSTEDMSTRPTITFGNKACGLWSKYKNDEWPASHGFYAGLDRYGNASYVGRGNYADVETIGRLQLTGTRGVYVTDGNEALATVPEYLVVPNDCNCEFMAFGVGATKVGLVRSPNQNFELAVGRKNFTSGRIALTSVRVDLGGNNQWYYNEAGARINDAATELLVCETP
jgi:hypothetical protein